MRQRMNFPQIASTLAALGATSLTAGDLVAGPGASPVMAREVLHAVTLGEGDSGDKEKEKGKDKDRDKGEGDEGAGDKDESKKKKGKKEGRCGGHGGCGAGACG